MEDVVKGPTGLASLGEKNKRATRVLVPVRRTIPRLLRESLCVLVLCASDVASITGVVLLGIVEQDFLSSWFRFLPLTSFTWVHAVGLLFTAVSVGFLLRGHYLRRETFWDYVRITVTTVAVSLIVAISALYLLHVADETPRSLAILAGVNLMIILPMVRLVSVKALSAIGVWNRRVMVVGDAAEIQALSDDLKSDYVLGYSVVSAKEVGDHTSDIEVPAGVDEVVVTGVGMAPERLHELVSALHRSVPKVTLAPDLGKLPFGRGMTKFIFDRHRILLTNQNLLKEPANIFVKRTFDGVASIALSILVLPVMLAIAVAIRLDSRGGAIYSQERVGRGGRLFRCLKFRTMFLDAEERLAKILAEDGVRRAEWERFHKLREDPRVTRVGKFLRATSLDELPQFFNVIFGQMSLVGPRPLPQYHYDKFEEPFRSDYLDVLPGVTGLWQVSGRSDADLEQMALLNSWYAHNWSLWLDFTILLRTIPIVFFQRGAY
jgi:undecaprenyl-phosphate galactose phosphotransferase